MSLLLAATLAALLAWRLRLPPVLGVAVAAPFLPPPHALQALVPWLLPLLLFAAALEIDALHWRDDMQPMAWLATAGTALAALAVAAVAHWLLPLSWPLALLAGSLLALGDPCAMQAVFRRLRTPPQLAALLGGEGLFGSGTALLGVQVLVAVVLTGRFNPAGTALATLGGLLLGMAAAAVAAWLLLRVDDALFRGAATTLLALGVYALAGQLHVSGAFAAAGAGLVVGNAVPRPALPLAYWEQLAFATAATAFALAAPAFHPAQLPAALAVLAALLLCRLALAFVLLRPELPRPLLALGGLRGAPALAAALALPAGQEELLGLAFGVVTLSLLLQGATLGLLVPVRGIRLS